MKVIVFAEEFTEYTLTGWTIPAIVTITASFETGLKPISKDDTVPFDVVSNTATVAELTEFAAAKAALACMNAELAWLNAPAEPELVLAAYILFSLFFKAN